MKLQASAVGLAVLLTAIGMSLVTAQTRKGSPQTKPAEAGAYTLSGPYQFKNLTIFLIHGKDAIQSKTILTLQEAMEQKKVVVIETKEVNELAIENLSKSEEVFVQSGDIVKGGQQDRVLAVDLILPPRSGKIQIAAFCVESGRWSKRGNEEAGKFNSSSDRIATKDLKLAANSAKSQSEVWEKVSEAQAKLSANVGGTVNSAESESSLQLSLENKRVAETTDTYLKNLSRIIEGQADVIGYAFAINGHVNSADVYASNALFRKLWPKLLKATAVEAVSELNRSKDSPEVRDEQVRAFLSASAGGRASESNVNERTKKVMRETEENVFLESRDTKQKEIWVHRSYIRK